MLSSVSLKEFLEIVEFKVKDYNEIKWVSDLEKTLDALIAMGFEND